MDRQEMDTKSLLESLGESVDTSTYEDPNNNDKPVSVSTTVHQKGTTSSVEERALNLLGSGVAAESVAAALGVTPARISQLLSNEEFALAVATKRYEELQKHNLRDNKYDSIEDRLLEKLESSLPLMVRPDTILKAITIVNGAKRRGQSSPDQQVAKQNIVNLTLPVQVVKQFIKSSDNHVLKAGDQELTTMPSNDLLQAVTKAEENNNRVLEHIPNEQSPD